MFVIQLPLRLFAQRGGIARQTARLSRGQERFVRQRARQEVRQPRCKSIVIQLARRLGKIDEARRTEQCRDGCSQCLLNRRAFFELRLEQLDVSRHLIRSHGPPECSRRDSLQHSLGIGDGIFRHDLELGPI